MHTSIYIHTYRYERERETKKDREVVGGSKTDLDFQTY